MSNAPSSEQIPDDSYKINPLALHIYKMFNQELVEEYEFLKIQLEVATESHGKRFKFTEPQRRKLVNAGIPVKAHPEEVCEIGTLMEAVHSISHGFYMVMRFLYRGSMDGWRVTDILFKPFIQMRLPILLMLNVILSWAVC